MKMNRSLLLFIALCATSASVQSGSIQVPDQPKVSLRFISRAIAPGAVVKAEVVVIFAPGMHGYQNPPMRDYEIPVSLASDPKKGPTIKPSYPKGVEIDFAGSKTLAYEGTVVIPFTFIASKSLGDHKVTVSVTTQQCNEGNCFPPNVEAVVGAYRVIKPSKTPR